MRVITVVGVVSACLAASLAAQRSGTVEFGTFGTFTRFDKGYKLPNRVGAGGRLAYYFTDNLGLELEGIWLGPSTLAGDPTYNHLHAGSASLVLSGGSDALSLHILAGASRIDMGTTPPYNFAENLGHGGIGMDLRLTNHVALRAEGRAYYWTTSQLTGLWVGHIIGSAGLSFFTRGLGGPRYVAQRPRQPAPEGVPDEDKDGVPDSRDACPGTPLGTNVDNRGCAAPAPVGGGVAGPVRLEGRLGSRHYQWYWGGQGGILSFQTNVQGYTFAPVFGAHWLITSRRTSLYVGYEQSFFINDANAVIYDPQSSGSSVGPGFRDVTFDQLRRIMFGVIAFPTEKHIEPLVGMGFSLTQVLNPLVDCSGCTSLSELASAQDRAAEAASKAFFWVMGGVSISQGKMSLFGHYVLTSSAQGFLLQGNTHTLQGGLRYSLGTSKEGVTEQH